MKNCTPLACSAEAGWSWLFLLFTSALLNTTVATAQVSNKTSLSSVPTTSLFFGPFDGKGRAANSLAGAASDSVPAARIAHDHPPLVHAEDVTWIDLDEDTNYTERHECSFVQSGQAFILFGGRENADIPDIYDYQANSWKTGAQAPAEFNHFQATAYEGLVWIIGSFKDNRFPVEAPTEYVFLYDALQDEWIQGPEIPENRRRGSAGLALYQDKFYVVGGNTIGHDGGFVAWFDEFDPLTGAWNPLADAPHERDHFHAAVHGDKLYAVAGRLSGGEGGVFAPLVPEVDIYDFTNSSWSTLPVNLNIPTPRAAPSVAVFDDEIFVMGGESTEVENTAYDLVEAFDPIGESWSNKAPMNYPRHGTQAIVSGNGIYVLAGSPRRGGGRQRNLEVYNQDAPAGSLLVAGTLNAPDAIQFRIGASDSLGVPLSNTGGNQGILITNLSITGPDAANFELVSWTGQPFLLKSESTLDLPIRYLGNEAGESAFLEISFHTSESSLIVPLSSILPEPFAAGIEEFRLLDAVSDTDLGPLVDGAVYNFSELPSLVDVLVNADQPVGSIVFELSGPITTTRIESNPPYVLFGNFGDDYTGNPFPPGSYQLIATPFSEVGGNGQTGIADTVQFTILDDQLINLPPLVDVGPDLEFELPLSNPILNTSVSDDGLPFGLLTFSWTLLEATPGGTLILSSDIVQEPTITVATTGTYSLELRVSDGALDAADTLQVVILSTQDDPTLLISGISLFRVRTNQIEGNTLSDGVRFPVYFPTAYALETELPPVNRVESVSFSLNGPLEGTWTEESQPFRFSGRQALPHQGFKWPSGDYVLTATPYAGANASGENGPSFTLEFTIAGNQPVYLPQERFTNFQERFLVWPNPVSQFVTIQSMDLIQEEVQIIVWDAFGKKVYEADLLDLGEVAKRIDTQQWLPGYYVLSIRSSGEVTTLRMLKN